MTALVDKLASEHSIIVVGSTGDVCGCDCGFDDFDGTGNGDSTVRHLLEVAIAAARPAPAAPWRTWLLGSHVRHIGIWAQINGEIGCAPLCETRRPTAKTAPWPWVQTPTQMSRPVCAYCRRRAVRLIGAIQ